MQSPAVPPHVPARLVTDFVYSDMRGETDVYRHFHRLHDGGVLWCTPMPRNVLVQHGDLPRLLLCDAPAAVFWPTPVPEPHRRLDLYDAVASPSRRREWSASERLRCLLAYAHGDRTRARELWRCLHRRSRTGHRLRKNLLMALRTYILRRRATATSGARRR